MCLVNDTTASTNNNDSSPPGNDGGNGGSDDDASTNNNETSSDLKETKNDDSSSSSGSSSRTTTTTRSTTTRTESLMMEEEEKGKSRTCRELPFLSKVLFIPIVIVTAFCHVVCSWLKIDESSLSMLITGGLFGLFVIPIGFYWMMLVWIDSVVERFHILEWLVETLHVPMTVAMQQVGDNHHDDQDGDGIPIVVSSLIVQYVLVPIVIAYMIQTLWLNQLHCTAKDSNVYQTKWWLEEASKQFFCASVQYFPITVVPTWTSTTTTTNTNTTTTNTTISQQQPQQVDTTTNSTTSTTLLDPSKQYIFGVHPHGIHCMPLGVFTYEGSPFDQLFPGLVGYQLTGLAATVMFKIPLVRELFLLMGYVDASRHVAQQVLEEGRSLYICIGGEQESMIIPQQGEDVVILRHRKGFVRLALSYGAALVPVFGVGNSDLYTTYSIWLKQRQWIQKKLGIALPIFHGRYFTPLPYKKPVQVLIGKPIYTPQPKVQGERPDPKLVDEYHTKYIHALLELHSNHVPNRTLRID